MSDVPCTAGSCISPQISPLKKKPVNLHIGPSDHPFAGPLDLLDKGRRGEVDLMSSQDTPAAEDHGKECDQE